MKRYRLINLLFVLFVARLLAACVQAPLGQPGAVQIQEKQAAAQAYPPPIDSGAVEPASTGGDVATSQPLASTGSLPWFAYIGQDGNLWLAGGVPLTHVQFTFDATGLNPGEDLATVAYHDLKWSPDGKLLAYMRQEGTPNAAGYYFEDSLWIYNYPASQASPVFLDQSIIGYDWKPGTHQIAFGQPLADQYFGDNGPDSDLARGIRLFDADTGTFSDLVAPVRGYHLVDPRWSPNGRFLSAREAILAEGSTTLMIYDTQTSSYYPWQWQEPVGEYAWSFDSDVIYFDTLTYVPQGQEAIHVMSWDGEEPALFSDMLDNGVSRMPRASLSEPLVAYVVDVIPPDGNYSSELVVVDTRNNEKRTGGTFDNILSMSWSDGWAHLLLSAGSYENPTIYLVNPFNGTREILTQGTEPAWNPAVKLQ